MITYSQGRIWADMKIVKQHVRASGLRSKSTRKIMKRWKWLVNEGLKNYLKLNGALPNAQD